MSRHSVVELAEGLALTSQPRWLDRLRSLAGPRGRVVSWCPQQRVLAHASTACFISHCGWNSAVEGVSNGVPFLCWPYFADQLLNQSYICDVWRTGLRVAPAPATADEPARIVERELIRRKVEELLGDPEMKAREPAMRDAARLAVGDGGSSRRNLTRFLDLIRS